VTHNGDSRPSRAHHGRFERSREGGSPQHRHTRTWGTRARSAVSVSGVAATRWRAASLSIWDDRVRASTRGSHCECIWFRDTRHVLGMDQHPLPHTRPPHVTVCTARSAAKDDAEAFPCCAIGRWYLVSQPASDGSERSLSVPISMTNASHHDAPTVSRRHRCRRHRQLRRHR
jgi:hypothetical protein